MGEQLRTISVAPESFEISAESVLLVADLQGALAVCLHDEGRRAGGLLHLRFGGPNGCPGDVTDDALSAILTVLDNFKTAVLGATPRLDDVQARILAHAPPPTGECEPKVSLVELIRADFTDAKISCGTQTLRRIEPVRVFFQPFEGRVWISAPSDIRATQNRRSSLA
jgi:hypothetical protein